MGLYSDPEGTFSSIRTTAAAGANETYRAAPQFGVSLGKLAVMSLVTLGFYQLYWAYKQWDAIRRREQENLMPFWRAFFGVLWGFSLFPRIRHLGDVHGVSATWSGSAVALAYFLISVTWRLPGAFWLISTLSFLPLLLVQDAINDLNTAVAPDAPRNDTYSGLNVVGIFLGGCFLLLAIFGTLIPER